MKFVSGFHHQFVIHAGLVSRRKNVLAGAREASLTRLFIVKQRGTRCGGADEIVRQHGSPHFTLNHLRRFAPSVVMTSMDLVRRPGSTGFLPIGEFTLEEFPFLLAALLLIQRIAM